MSERYDPNKPVYRIGEDMFSIAELLSSAITEEFMANGLPRISDFHLKVGDTMRFRMDRELQSVPEGAILTDENVRDMVFPLLKPELVKEMLANPMADVDSSFELPGGNFHFRVNAFRDRNGLAAVVRLLPPNVPPIEELNFPNEMTWQCIAGADHGLVLVTGPTGSGKSTTIAALLHRINDTRPLRIITLEDPIEFVFPNGRCLFSQCEIGRHAKDFASGVRGILRRAPDVIFVGEIRDAETAAQAMTAAETGHLVFSTLHTRDSIGALTRLVDIFPSSRSKELSVQLSFSLSYVLSQKLVPRADGRGRIMAMEILRNGPGVSNLIRNGSWTHLYSAMETRYREGMCTMEQALVRLFEDGLITYDEALSHANDVSIIDRLDALVGEPER